MSGRTTILRPPPDDPNKSEIENVLEVTELGVLGPDIFTNARPAWTPPGARGIFGGLVIAQSLAAAQRTVHSGTELPPFFMHSCHCYFLLAGSSDVPILFHVERVRDGRSFATRTVQARQRGRCIFTVTVSFVREGAGGEKAARHAAPLPAGVTPPAADDAAFEEPWMGMGPFQARPTDIVDADGKSLADAVAEGSHADGREHEMKARMWTRARGTISPEGGHDAHLIALAYVSDSYFIGTVSRVHRLWKFPFEPSAVASMDPERKELIRRLHHFDGIGGDIEDAAHWDSRPKLGMVVSLDHSIYFHEPRRIKADEWMFCEMETPWAGDGRGVVNQRIFAADGTLLATCVQEGVLRLKRDEEDDEKPSSKL
ncbi:acyl-CoA thioesterase II [Plectosphaerella plurivora]|uniref:Acyl-CoA thioesterase II n=1 Tax=Plectosphaerella plurivora TaxID=936078 RepID=A0A9P8VMX3_9PEZI|nr:acyl-CoA thioesterase II [Plectosphaerella plurivora]